MRVAAPIGSVISLALAFLQANSPQTNGARDATPNQPQAVESAPAERDGPSLDSPETYRELNQPNQLRQTQRDVQTRQQGATELDPLPPPRHEEVRRASPDREQLPPQRDDQQTSRDVTPQRETVAGSGRRDGDRSGGEDWRYRWHQGRWWYWLPSDRWAVWYDGRWNDYRPGARIGVTRRPQYRTDRNLGRGYDSRVPGPRYRTGYRGPYDGDRYRYNDGRYNRDRGRSGVYIGPEGPAVRLNF